MRDPDIIPKRYCGPPNSANGGYTCGLTALALGDPDVEVMLLAPPPLERPLRYERDADSMRLLDGEQVIAVARPTDGPVTIPPDAPPLLGYDTVVEAAETTFDVDEYRAHHDFPTCFTCGPDRAEGDGLRIFPAPTDRPDRYVWPWTPAASLFDTGGSIDPRVVWAALDCQSGLAWIRQAPGLGAVLGRMAATVHRAPRPSERLVVVGWTEPAQGRRRPARSAIYSDDGEVLATARATWVELTDEQRAAFRSAPA